MNTLTRLALNKVSVKTAIFLIEREESRWSSLNWQV